MNNVITISIINYSLLIKIRQKFVVPGRLELPTSTLSVWRSNQLSYRTVFGFQSLESHLPIIFIKQIRVQEALGSIQTNFLFI